MEHYYNILELSSSASDAEVRKAFRRLARKYHPDVNPSPDAEERFVEIMEAYEYLTDKPSARPVTYKYEEPVMDAEDQRRERARQYARMRYDEFQRTTMEFQRAWYYTPLKLFRYLVIYVLYFIALIMLISPVLAWFITHSGGYTFGYTFVAIVSSQVYVLARSIEKGTEAYFQE